jgi:hypothetical protein
VQDLAASSGWHDAVFDVRNLNGQYFLTATGLVNRQREEVHRLEELLSLVAEHLPGSWGLVYERDDEMPRTSDRTGFASASSAAVSLRKRPTRSCPL